MSVYLRVALKLMKYRGRVAVRTRNTRWRRIGESKVCFPFPSKQESSAAQASKQNNMMNHKCRPYLTSFSDKRRDADYTVLAKRTTSDLFATSCFLLYSGLGIQEVSV